MLILLSIHCPVYIYMYVAGCLINDIVLWIVFSDYSSLLFVISRLFPTLLPRIRLLRSWNLVPGCLRTGPIVYVSWFSSSYPYTVFSIISLSKFKVVYWPLFLAWTNRRLNSRLCCLTRSVKSSCTRWFESTFNTRLALCNSLCPWTW